MQHAVALSGEEDDQVTQAVPFSDVESGAGRPATSEPTKLVLSYTWSGIKGLFHLLHPSTIRRGYDQFRQMTFKDMIKNLFLLFIKCIRLLFIILIYALRYVDRKSSFMHEICSVEFFFSLHVFLIMKCLLTKRCYYRLTKKFQRYNENFNNTQLKSKQNDDNHQLFISRRSKMSNNDDRRFFRRAESTNLFFNERNSSQLHYRCIDKSSSSDIDTKMKRFVSRCISSL